MDIILYGVNTAHASSCHSLGRHGLAGTPEFPPPQLCSFPLNLDVPMSVKWWVALGPLPPSEPFQH